MGAGFQGTEQGWRKSEGEIRHCPEVLPERAPDVNNPRADGVLTNDNRRSLRSACDRGTGSLPSFLLVAFHQQRRSWLRGLDFEGYANRQRPTVTATPAAAFRRSTTELEISCCCVYRGSGACTTSLTRTRVRQDPTPRPVHSPRPRTQKTNFLLRDRWPFRLALAELIDGGRQRRRVALQNRLRVPVARTSG